MNFSPARQLAAEFIGTLILVATVVGSGIQADRMTVDTAVALWGNTAATGAILVVLILVFGPVSGAHFNPVVTLVMRLKRDIGTVLALGFVLVQFLGGLAGTALAHLMFEAEIIQFAATTRTGEAQWLSEAVATFALIAAILGALRFKPDAVPYAVGLVITAGYWWTASTSFANPAVTLARGFSDSFSGIRPGDIAPFIAAQVAGGVICLVFFNWLFARHLQNRSGS